MMRLDKYLAEMRVGTRQEVKKQIRQGKVTVNGTVVKAADTKIDETCDEVTIGGRNISYVSYEYYMLNKPGGVVSATEDRRDTTVIDLIKDKKRKDLFPVGRLDKDTEGLLLITNDGDLAHRLLAPKKHVDKVYYTKVDGELEEDDVAAFAEGITLGDGTVCLPAGLDLISEREALVTLREGKYHQVRRMLASRGLPVTYLRREAEGRLTLGDLPLGQTKELNIVEAEQLLLNIL